MPLELFPYQEEGADWIARRERAGLFDEMGVGKTATTIRALDLRRAKRGLIVCPAHLRENWRGEFAKFAHVERKIIKARNIHDYVAWSRERFDTMIMSYEQANAWLPRFMDTGDLFDFIACDEAHYLKNIDAGRTKAVLGPEGDGTGGLMQFAEQGWIVTGTPMANDPIDIFPFLRFVRAFQGSKPEFIRRFFHSRPTTYGSSQKPKIEGLPELQRLIADHSIRRTKKGIGLQLPPIFLTTVLVDGDTDDIRDMLAQHPGLEQAVIDAIGAGGLSFLDAQHIMTLRRLIGEAKAIPFAHMLLDELQQGMDKVVVMGVHRNALISIKDFLERHGIRCVLGIGGINENVRKANEHAFQSDPSVRVFLGNIVSAGTGLTLTAACELVMLESDWSPAGNAQAIMRVHRISQTRSVRARFITLARSLDEVVNRIVAEKTKAIADIEGEAMVASPVSIEDLM